MSESKFPELLQVRLPAGTTALLDRAAEDDMTRRSDFVRGLLVAGLRSKGLPVGVERAMPGLAALYRVLEGAGASVAPGGA